MKKLSFLISIICIFFLSASCNNSRKSKSENKNEFKPTITNQTVATDTTKASNETSVSGTIGADQGVKKDTNLIPLDSQAIIHKSPEQQKIDSIKNAKMKNKNAPK